MGRGQSHAQMSTHQASSRQPRQDELREELIERYTSEGCAHLALELHQQTGLPLAILWDNAALDDWGQGPEPTPAHVFVFDEATGEALDIKGRRSLDELKDDFFDLEEPEVDARVSEDEVLSLMGDDRPLYPSSPKEGLGARAAIATLALS